MTVLVSPATDRLCMEWAKQWKHLMSVYNHHALLGNVPALSEILLDIDSLDIFLYRSAHKCM